MVKRTLFTLIVPILGIVMLTGCHAHHKAVTHSHSRYFDGISLGRHSKNSATTDAIDKNGKYPVRKKNSSAPAAEKEYDAPGKKELKNKYADKLGISKKDINNTALYYFIDEWYGTPYHMGGTDRNGIDCSGFVQKLYAEVYQIPLPHSSRDQHSNCKLYNTTANAQEGDLIFFKTLGKHISHVGVYLWNDFFVHASTSQGIVISNLNEAYWQKHFVGVGRLKK